MQNLMQIHCSTCSVILNAMATQCTCSLNGVYCPHWLVQWSCHCSYMRIPVHSPLATRLQRCCAYQSRYINNGWTFFLIDLEYIHLIRKYYYYFFKKYFIYLFLERWRETSMCKRNISQLLLSNPQLGTWPTTQACALTGNRTSDLSVHRLVLSPHQPGPANIIEWILGESAKS